MAILPEPDAADALDAAKGYLRMATTDEDGLLTDCLQAAAAVCEDFTRLRLVRGEVVEPVPRSTAWTRLSATPVGAISSVADQAGGAIGPDDYAIDIDVAGDGWIKFAMAGGQVDVTYLAGTAVGWSDLAPPLRHGLVRLAAHLFVDRDGRDEPPAAVTALWRPFRRMRLR